MPEDKLKFLGDRIRSARKDCGLTQQALADQADLAVKTNEGERIQLMKPFAS